VSSDYRQMFGLTPQRIAKLAPHVIILHPGPMNRGIEIDDRVADDPQRSRILRQVTHGVAARMAVLEMVLSDFSSEKSVGTTTISTAGNRVEV
ncbi:MAG: hypothetical protein WCL33_11445, partial [Planctomycetota bacterium]